ncbi:hypothetical protein [Streptomyces sp. NBC_01506]|uniref:hypothetical protein n=1 Tax=Streptomyces sp. NBC_01506 TaxID=2903887 RepID=UPI003869B8AD
MNWNPFKRKSVGAPTVVIQHDELNGALAVLAGAFGDGMTADQTGPGFTCAEADSVARVLALTGYKPEAVTWLEGHASGDEGDDSHFLYENDEGGEGHVMNADEIASYVEELAA